MARHVWLVLALAAWMSGCQTVSPLPLVRSDVSPALVVLPKAASEEERFAADELVRCVKKACGTSLSVVSEDTAGEGDGVRIHVGRDAYVESRGLGLDRLDLDGFVVKTPDSRNLILAGRKPWGTQFAVFEFLERCLGVRWFFPGEDGEVIPARESIEIGPINLAEEPAFLSRQFSGLRGEGALWMKHNKMRVRFSFHHNLNHILKPSVYAKTHPEFFPIKDGKRFIPPDDNTHAWQPCFTAKGSVEEAVKVISDYFAAHPDEMSFSLGVNDSGGHCECDACKAKDTPDKKFLGLYRDVSDAYFEWANAVVEGVSRTYPDKVFGCLAYSNVGNPPERVKVNAQIVPYITYDRMMYYDLERKSANEEVIRSWRRACPSIGLYDYIYGWPYLIPRYYPHLMAEYWRFAKEVGVKGMYAEAYPNWGEGPKLYVAAKLLWDPGLDVDRLLSDYFDKCYGAAGGEMRQYFDLWEEIWHDRVPKTEWFKSCQGQYLAFYTCEYLDVVTEGDVSKARSLIDSALAKADSPGARKRVEVMAKMFRFYELNCLVFLGHRKCSAGAPRDDKEAADLMKVGARTADLCAERQKCLNEMLPKDSLLAPAMAMDRFASLNWMGWGQTGLWAGIGFALDNPGGEAAKALREIASTPSPAGEAARDVLDITEGKNAKGLLSNGGFEEGDKTPAQWNYWTRDNIGRIALVSDHARSGKRAILLTGIVRGGPHQTAPVAVGRRYLAVAFARAELVPNSTGAAVLLVGYRGADKKNIAGLSDAMTKLRPPADRWVAVCVPFTVSDSRISHVLVCPAADNLGEGEKVWYDDVMLYEFQK